MSYLNKDADPSLTLHYNAVEYLFLKGQLTKIKTRLKKNEEIEICEQLIQKLESEFKAVKGQHYEAQLLAVIG